MAVTLANAKPAVKRLLFVSVDSADYVDPMEINEVRRHNLADLVREYGGQDELASALGVTPSYVSQLLNRTRPITEKTARKYEAKLRKPRGWFDLNGAVFAGASDPDGARELVELIAGLPDDERDYWIRMIRERPRRP